MDSSLPDVTGVPKVIRLGMTKERGIVFEDVWDGEHCSRVKLRSAPDSLLRGAQVTRAHVHRLRNREPGCRMIR